MNNNYLGVLAAVFVGNSMNEMLNLSVTIVESGSVFLYDSADCHTVSEEEAETWSQVLSDNNIRVEVSECKCDLQGSFVVGLAELLSRSEATIYRKASNTGIAYYEDACVYARAVRGNWSVAVFLDDLNNEVTVHNLFDLIVGYYFNKDGSMVTLYNTVNAERMKPTIEQLEGVLIKDDVVDLSTITQYLKHELVKSGKTQIETSLYCSKSEESPNSSVSMYLGGGSLEKFSLI